jgi:hypothetical protein
MKSPSLDLAIIPGCEKWQFLHHVAPEQARWETVLAASGMVVADIAARIRRSKADFPLPFFRGDFHSHTHHSDGVGSVAETAEMVKRAELDFQFVTDHWGLTQAPECREHGLWVGQEPTTEFHHLAILGYGKVFTPGGRFLEDYKVLTEAGATVFIAHPAGWWPNTVYSQEQKDILRKLPTPFLMEICNGADNLVSAFDSIDDLAIRLWDELLCEGRHVYAVGNTDAHMPHGIGMVWNAVYAEKCEEAIILSEIRKGHSFISDAPLVYITLGGAKMGDLATDDDCKKALEITIADAGGLSELRVVADGHEIHYRLFRGDTKFQECLLLERRVTNYIRVEVRSRDGRRAYSNPIFLS